MKLKHTILIFLATFLLTSCYTNIHTQHRPYIHEEDRALSYAYVDQDLDNYSFTLSFYPGYSYNYWDYRPYYGYYNVHYYNWYWDSYPWYYMSYNNWNYYKHHNHYSKPYFKTSTSDYKRDWDKRSPYKRGIKTNKPQNTDGNSSITRGSRRVSSGTKKAKEGDERKRTVQRQNVHEQKSRSVRKVLQKVRGSQKERGPSATSDKRTKIKNRATKSSVEQNSNTKQVRKRSSSNRNDTRKTDGD